MLKQISVFIENKRGRLAAMTDVLAKNNVDLIALSIADTTNFGILRCIVNKVDVAVKALKDAGFTANITDVICVQVEDKPGGLSSILELLNKNEITVEYLYSFVRRSDKGGLILLRVDDLLKASELFIKNNVTIVDEKQIGIIE